MKYLVLLLCFLPQVLCYQINIHKTENITRQLKRNDSLIAVYTYENQFYMTAIEGYNENLLLKNKKK
jgi:hypothetical protein